MNCLRIGMLAAASLAVFGASACDEPEPATPAAAASTPSAPEPAAPAAPPPMGGETRWQASGDGSSATGEGFAGKATIGGNGLLAVVVHGSPVVAGDVVNVKGNLTAPAGRSVRLVVMRHCDPTNGEDASSTEVVGTGAPVAFEITHTFQAAYSCIRLAAAPADKLAIDISISDLQLSKTKS